MKKIAYILVDLEGSTGCQKKEDYLLGTKGWNRARIELTKDVNAIIDGLREIGIKTIFIRDYHRNCFNIVSNLLHNDVKLIQGIYLWFNPGLGYIPKADFLIMYGFHASSGNKKGFLSHTLTTKISEIKINGIHISETDFFTQVFQKKSIPLIFFGGGKYACKEVKNHFKRVKTFIIDKEKNLTNKEYTDFVYKIRHNLQKEIKNTVLKFYEEKYSIEDYFFNILPPYECSIEFKDIETANNRNNFNYLQKDRTIFFRSENLADLQVNIFKIAYLNRFLYYFRYIGLWVYRLYHRIKWNCIYLPKNKN